MSPRRIVCDGNSLTFGTGASGGLSYPDQLRALYLGQNDVINVGIGGKTTQQLIDDFASKTAPQFRNGADLVWFEQRNGFAAGQTVEQEQTLAQTYTALAKAAGFRVWICSPPPTADAHATKIQEYSTWLRSNHAFADGFIDLNACAELTPAGVDDNPTYYSDATHLTAAGYGILAATIYAELE